MFTGTLSEEDYAPVHVRRLSQDGSIQSFGTNSLGFQLQLKVFDIKQAYAKLCHENKSLNKKQCVN